MIDDDVLLLLLMAEKCVSAWHQLTPGATRERFDIISLSLDSLKTEDHHSELLPPSFYIIYQWVGLFCWKSAALEWRKTKSLSILIVSVIKVRKKN